MMSCKNKALACSLSFSSVQELRLIRTTIKGMQDAQKEPPTPELRLDQGIKRAEKSEHAKNINVLLNVIDQRGYCLFFSILQQRFKKIKSKRKIHNIQKGIFQFLHTSINIIRGRSLPILERFRFFILQRLGPYDFVIVLV